MAENEHPRHLCCVGLATYSIQTRGHMSVVLPVVDKLVRVQSIGRTF